MKLALLIFGLIVLGVLALIFTGQTQGEKTHMTIYVEPPLLTEGGVVTVHAMKVPLEEWMAEKPEKKNVLPDQKFVAANPDVDLSKYISVTAGQRFTIVQFKYPDTGSYSFNFVPAPNHDYPAEEFFTTLLSSGTDDMVEDRIGFNIPSSTLQTIRVIPRGGAADDKEANTWGRSIEAAYDTRNPEIKLTCRSFYQAVSCAPDDKSYKLMETIAKKPEAR